LAGKLISNERENTAQNKIRLSLNEHITKSPYYENLRAEKISFVNNKMSIILGFSTAMVSDKFIQDLFLEAKNSIEELTGSAVSARLLGVNKERTQVEPNMIPTLESLSMWEVFDTSGRMQPQEGFYNYFEIIIRIL